MSRSIDVSGLRVLVTAGGAGIGRAIAAAFLEGGAQVHITDIDAAALSATLADLPGLSGTPADASDPAAADRVVAEMARRFDGLDVLINNVGIAGPTAPIDAVTDAEAKATLDVNLAAHFYVLSRCVPLLKRSQRGSIIEISSVAGRLGYPFRTPYAASKWAIVGLIKSLAVELGPSGIRANAILPGVVAGARIERVIEGRARAKNQGIEQTRTELVANVSMKTMVEAADIANLALFLASDLARYISGQAISVDGNVEHL